MSDRPEDLAGALQRIKELAVAPASKEIGGLLQLAEEFISPYPPQPDRMRSGRFNGYVRGIGRFPKSAFMPSGGLRRGARKKFSVKLTSQHLDKSWKQQVTAAKDGVTGLLQNTATYSGYVSGYEDETPDTNAQVDFHALTGWKSADDTLELVEREANAAANRIADEVVRMIVEA